MDNRYLIVGFLSLILGLFFFTMTRLTFFIFDNVAFNIIILFANLFGIVFITVGVLEPSPNEVKKKVANKSENPINTLKMRYAKGEITEEKYKKMKKELEG